MDSRFRSMLTDEELMHRIVFNLLALVCVVIITPTVIFTMIFDELNYVHYMMMAGVIMIVVNLVFRRKKINFQNANMMLLLFINMMVLPAMMFNSGGLSSFISMWFLGGLLACMCVLKGWRRTMSCSLIAADMICGYLYCYLYPEKISDYRVNRSTVFKTELATFVIISALIAILIYIKTAVIESKTAEIARKNEELEQAMKTQSTFLANMSHEIRTPINTIIGLNERNLREDVSDEVYENSDNIKSASKMLLSVINDIMDISRIESGKMEIVEDRYDLSQMLSDIINMNWMRAQAKGLEFMVEISEDLPVAVMGDEIRIKQIVNNLFSNAIKYTKEGYVRLTVSGESMEDGATRLSFIVEDTGIGIKITDLPHLFDNFSRLDEHNTKGIEGTGLGLSITKQLVELMKGTINVDSVYHKGSTFTVELTQEVLDASPIGKLDMLHQSKKSDRIYKNKFEAPSARILVVDDNEMNLMVVKKLLRETRINVHQANGGPKALEYTLNNKYDVILMDHVMPMMDGVETLMRIRNQEGGLNRETPILALTANVMSCAEERYFKMGFSGYIAKPVSGELLEMALLEFLPTNVVDRVEEEELVKPSGEVIFSQGKYLKPVIITMDSVGDMPSDIRDNTDIRIINYYVETEEGRFLDGEEIFADGAIAYMRQGGKAKSFSPSVEDYEQFFAQQLKEGRHVIHLALADSMDTGYKNALKAAECFSSVSVIDTGQLSTGIALIAVEAYMMSDTADDYREIVDYIEHIKKKVVVSFTVETMDYLYHNGRMPVFFYHAFRTLGLRVNLRLKNNSLRVIKLYGANRELFIKRYIRNQFMGRNNIDTNRLYITGSGCLSRDKEIIVNEVKKYQNFKEIYFTEASAAVAMNCGPGTFGLIFKKV